MPTKHLCYLSGFALICSLFLAACGDTIPASVTSPAASNPAATINEPTTKIVNSLDTATNLPATAPVEVPTTVPNTATPAPAPTDKPITSVRVVPVNPTATSTPAITPMVNLPITGEETLNYNTRGETLLVTFFSPVLQKTVPYQIYLPPDYNSSKLSYPVLYMLHGISGQVEEWNFYGLMGRYDDLLKSGQVKPFIIVLPYGEQSYWVDAANNGTRWGEYVAEDVVNHIDANYRTLRQPASRALGGLSMGANGALQISMNYPGIFGVVGAHSPTMRTFQNKLPAWGDLNWFNQHDPITLAKTSPYLPKVKLWLDVGLQDVAWRSRAEELRRVLDNRKISYTWKDYPGNHDAEYWSSHVVDYLNWYNSVLQFSPGLN